MTTVRKRSRTDRPLRRPPFSRIPLTSPSPKTMADLTHWLMICGKVLLALVITMPLALNREKNTRIMGLRTFPRVSAATCAYVLIAIDFIGGESPDANARIMQGILSGIGFVGGGAIIKDKNHVRGTACAASVWATGAIGIAVAYGNYPIAITLVAACFAVLHFLSPLKGTLGPDDKDTNSDDDESN